MRPKRLDRTIRPAACWAGLISCFVLFAHGGMAQGAVEDRQPIGDIGAGYLSVELHDNLVTLKANNVRLRVVLAEIARQCNLTVVSHDTLGARRSFEIGPLPLVDLIARIMREQSYLLHQTQVANDARGATLWVFSDGSGGEDGFTQSASRSEIELLRSDLMNDDIRVRQAAIRSLRRLDVNEVIAPLSYALADKDKKLRVKAIYALADIGGDDAVAVLAAASGDENAWVRAETAYALGTLGTDTAIQLLKHALYDADRNVRESAISAFAEIGGTQSAAALAVALQDVDMSLRVEAVEALRNVGGATAIDLLNQALQDRDDAVREAADDALADLSNRDQ